MNVLSLDNYGPRNKSNFPRHRLSEGAVSFIPANLGPQIKEVSSSKPQVVLIPQPMSAVVEYFSTTPDFAIGYDSCHRNKDESEQHPLEEPFSRLLMSSTPQEGSPRSWNSPKDILRCARSRSPRVHGLEEDFPRGCRQLDC